MENLIVDWSENMTDEELKYKSDGFNKTIGTVFQDAPPNDLLEKAFNMIIEPCKVSVGVIALQKHSDRGSRQTMIGNDFEKNKYAKNFIKDFMKSQIIWKNIHCIDGHNIIFEMRNKDYGMRWYVSENNRSDPIFRGLLEPFENYKNTFKKA